MSSSGWALVTGGSIGIGRELASLCAADGRNVVLVARNEQRLRRAADEIRENDGVKTLALPMDLSAPEAARRLHAATEERGIAVDFLINNAGFGMSRGFTAVPLEIQGAMIG